MSEIMVPQFGVLSEIEVQTAREYAQRYDGLNCWTAQRWLDTDADLRKQLASKDAELAAARAEIATLTARAESAEGVVKAYLDDHRDVQDTIAEPVMGPIDGGWQCGCDCCTKAKAVLAEAARSAGGEGKHGND